MQKPTGATGAAARGRALAPARSGSLPRAALYVLQEPKQQPSALGAGGAQDASESGPQGSCIAGARRRDPRPRVLSDAPRPPPRKGRAAGPRPPGGAGAPRKRGGRSRAAPAAAPPPPPRKQCGASPRSAARAESRTPPSACSQASGQQGGRGAPSPRAMGAARRRAGKRRGPEARGAGARARGRR